VPSAQRRPLTVRTHPGVQCVTSSCDKVAYAFFSVGKMSDSFIVPQWGGVVILDPSSLHAKNQSSHQNGIHLSTIDMTDSFNAFRTQLLALLGVTPLPSSVSTGSSFRRGKLSDWQLDTLLRRRALENTRDSKEALSSIVNLVDQIENMPVGQDVKGDVQGALDAIEQVSRLLI
jgi:GPI-anchor transamidase subunit S